MTSVFACVSVCFFVFHLLFYVNTLSIHVYRAIEKHRTCVENISDLIELILGQIKKKSAERKSHYLNTETKYRNRSQIVHVNKIKVRLR